MHPYLKVKTSLQTASNNNKGQDTITYDLLGQSYQLTYMKNKRARTLYKTYKLFVIMNIEHKFYTILATN